MEKIWLKNYKAGIPAEIKLDATTLVDMYDFACREYAGNRALSCHGVSFTFAELNQAVLRFAHGLAELGVGKGDRVALILPNCIQYPVSVFAILMLGASVVNLNPLYTAGEIDYILRDAEPKVVIILDMFAAKLNALHDKYSIQHIVVSKIADPYPWFKRSMLGLWQRYIAKVNPQLTYRPKSWLSIFSQVQLLGKRVVIDREDMAFLQYTGATTGRPKGAILLHRNMVANVRQIFAVIEPQLEQMDKQLVISALPLYHVFSLTANLLTFFLHGSENVLVPNAKNLKDLVKIMNKTPFTVFSGLDTLYSKLLEFKAFRAVKHPHYKYGICGGMAIRKSVVEAWHQQTGLIPPNCYGLTEAAPCVSMSYFDEPFSGSVGYPIPSTEIDIREITNVKLSLGVGEKGLIFVRGPQLMLGYWRNQSQTELALTADGWLNTGDVGYLNQQGQLTICGRETEMIKVSGFSVYPAEVERVIDELPEVHEVGVIGCPDPDSGEAVHAFIVLDQQCLISTEHILQHCRKSLAKYKLPSSITLVKELPKTSVGKVDKKMLLSKYLPGKVRPFSVG